MATALDKSFLKLLRCPLTGAPLVQAGDELIADCPDPAPRYPIIDGKPILTAEAARLPDGVSLDEVRRD